MATLIDGKAIAAKVRAEVAQGVAEMKAEHGQVPGLAVMRVGEDPASKIYVTSKRKVAAELGFHAVEVHLPEDVSHRLALERLEELNADPAIHGILVQLPVPKHIDPDALLAALRALAVTAVVVAAVMARGGTAANEGRCWY